LVKKDRVNFSTLRGDQYSQSSKKGLSGKEWRRLQKNSWRKKKNDKTLDPKILKRGEEKE